METKSTKNGHRREGVCRCQGVHQPEGGHDQEQDAAYALEGFHRL